MVQRLKTKREAAFWLLKLTYKIAFPVMVCAGLVLLYALSSSRPEAKIDGLPLLASLVWSAILIPVLVFIYRLLVRRRLIRSITAELRDQVFFDPDASHEVYHDGEGKYFGIDIHNGTLLYVHKIREGEVDVVAMNMSDWVRQEIEGETLTVFTKMPELPRIEIVTPWAQRFFDTLGAMAIKHRGSSNAFSSHVFRKLELLERQYGIQIPRIA